MEYDKPRFSIENKAFFKRKQVKTSFIDTKIVGDTSFVEIVLSKEAVPYSAATLQAVLVESVQTQNLGDAPVATFVADKDKSITEWIRKTHTPRRAAGDKRHATHWHFSNCSRRQRIPTGESKRLRCLLFLGTIAVKQSH